MPFDNLSEASIPDLENIKKQRIEEITAIGIDIENANKALDLAISKKEEKEKEVSKVKDLTDTLNGLEDTIQQKNTEVLSLESLYSSKKVELESQISNLYKQIDEHKMQVLQAHNTVNIDLETKKALADEAIKQLNTVQAQVNNITFDHNKAKEDLASLLAELENRQQEVSSFKLKSDNLKTEITNLSKEKAELQDAEKTIQLKQQEISDLNVSIEKEKVNLENYKKQSEEYESKNKEYEEKKADLEKKEGEINDKETWLESKAELLRTNKNELEKHFGVKINIVI
jgi:predicted  nucleic acid-binding Zn-ribbon protein